MTNGRPAPRAGLFTPVRGLWFGGDYNPEQWPREVWEEDVVLMRAAGVTTVTVGVFSWSLLEPTEGAFDADWLADVLDLLHSNGIDVILATPTASPPPWFTAAHPDALPVRADGSRLWHGSRDTYCLAAPAYREASTRIARRLAERLGTHPALVAWHVHNEYGTVCWCDHVARAFQRWLARRYATTKALNDAWGTAFWSQAYQTWDEVLPPRDTQYLHNPAHLVDFRRFCSDELLECFREQRDVIRAAGSDAPVTTNFMLPSWNTLEQWSWAAEEDLVSLDHYLDTTGPDGEAHVAYAGDLARSWAAGGPWLLMEQSASSIAVAGRTSPKPGDRMLRNSLSYVARGSQGSLFFQWRQSTAGAETWHGALVPHSGPDSATFAAACELGATLAALAEFAEPPDDGRVIDADVAILWHADGWWATEVDGLPSPDLSYADAIRRTHRALYRAGVPVDFVAPGAALAGYRLVLVPSMFALDDAAVTALERYVRQESGHLVIGPMTGISDETMRVVASGYPGRLREVLGVRVVGLHPLAPGESVVLSDGATADTWVEEVRAVDAEAALFYASGPTTGSPAVTRRTVPGEGGGEAVYLSTRLEQSALDAFVVALVERAGVRRVIDGPVPPAVEVVRRRGRLHDLVAVLNHGTADIVLRTPGAETLAGRPAFHAQVGAGGHLLVRVATTAPRPLTGWLVTAAGTQPSQVSC
ncbi:MAG: beta-galactosidase [Cellulomonadaceae bacterium]|nr:beta-galactosidase [Cellulomonadaceae bacterium]